MLLKEKTDQLDNIVNGVEMNNNDLKYDVEQIEVELEDLEKKITERNGDLKVPGEQIQSLMRDWRRLNKGN